MPALALQTEAFVLAQQPPTDAFQACTLFSGEHGALLALQRMPRKAPGKGVRLDLFDEAALILESSNQGRTWFVREARLRARPAAIGRSYEALRAASAFAALVARNPVGAESRAKVAALLRTAFGAFAGPTDPEIVLFKSLYCFGRDEGYPLRQEWIPSLPAALRAPAERLLRTPLAALEPSGAAPADRPALRRHLENYLRGHTDILVP